MGAPDPVDPRCALPATPTELVHDGEAILLRWDLPAGDTWFAPVVPDSAKYVAFRRTIREADAALERPISDAPPETTGPQREIWRRERANADLAYGGVARVRPIRCIEAALFAYQHARYDELTRPTELISLILRKDATLRVYFGASDQMFPPKQLYGTAEAEQDVANGWRVLGHLHNHTIGKRGDRPALGTPVPSTNDVLLLRGLRDDLHLEMVWVTNGYFTGEVPAVALDRFQTPP